jgi:hypothetical protein
MITIPALMLFEFFIMNNKKGNNQSCSLNINVELAGVEPASKRGSHKLSTCLSPTYFSCTGWIRATDRYLSSCFLTEVAEQNFSQPRFTCTAWPGRFVATAPGRCLVPEPCPGIKLITYLNSVTQQERNYFRQLWF